MQDSYTVPVYQMSGAPLARLNAKAETTIAQLITALCKKAGLEDGFLILACEGQVLDREHTVMMCNLNDKSFVTAIRYPENFVAASFEDGSTLVWSAESLQCERQLEGRRGAMLSVAFSNNGLSMATGCMDGNAYLWSLTTGKCERYYQGHKGGVASIDCSPDGALVATGSFDRVAHIWSLPSGDCKCKLPGHRGTVTAVAFSPDGKTLCTGSEDCSAKLWDVKEERGLLTGAHLAVHEGETLVGHGGGVLSVAWEPNSRHVATGSTDGTARIWNTKGKCRLLVQVADPGAHANIGGKGTGSVCSVAFSADGELLASGCSDGFAKLWHVHSGRELRRFQADPNKIVNVRSVDFSPAGLTLVTGTEDGVVSLWNITTGQQKAILYQGGSGVRQVTFAPGPGPPGDQEARKRSSLFNS